MASVASLFAPCAYVVVGLFSRRAGGAEICEIAAGREEHVGMSVEPEQTLRRTYLDNDLTLLTLNTASETGQTRALQSYILRGYL